MVELAEIYLNTTLSNKLSLGGYLHLSYNGSDKKNGFVSTVCVKITNWRTENLFGVTMEEDRGQGVFARLAPNAFEHAVEFKSYPIQGGPFSYRAILDWIQENTKGYWFLKVGLGSNVTAQDDHRVMAQQLLRERRVEFSFDDPREAVMFKLVWA